MPAHRFHVSLPIILCSLALVACATVVGCTPTGEGMVPDPMYPPEVLDTLDLPDVPYNYANIELPAHFQSGPVRAMDNTPVDNPVTDHGATLGRVLFYDTKLSANDTIACASCHVQEFAFADPETLSTGFEGGLTGRNSMALANARYYRNGRFFWDERAPTLEHQVLMPIQDAVEMGMTLEGLVAVVAEQPYYPALFERAFGDPEVTSERISMALAQFVRSMVSYRSRFDEGMAATGDIRPPFPNFTPEENQGKDIFLTPRGGCAACHLDNPPLQPGQAFGNQAIFFINGPANNGLDSDATATDLGVGGQTGASEDYGLFKSPSLRNVELTAPYMHDGSHYNLSAVIEFYSFGVQPHTNLDQRLRLPGSTEPRRLNLEDAELDALIAFLSTLTDTEFVTDPRYADPFL